MDINSILSPQETPRATPTPPTKPIAKKPRKPRASKLNQPSPLVNATLPPPTLSHGSVMQSHQHGGSSPANMSPSSGHHMSTGTTPPNDGPPRINRQPSTAGMDTLADLASMQHHQQTARVNAGGLRSAEIYDNPTSSASVLPSVLAMPRPQISNQLREPSQLIRGGSLDIPMADGPTDGPSPNMFSTSALSMSEIEMVSQLVDYLSTSPFAYQSHVQLINLLHQGFRNHVRSHGDQLAHKYDLYPKLCSAREAMNANFALGEDLWVDWLQDQILLAGSLEDRIAVMELCGRAVEEESGSTELWRIYGQFMLSLYRSTHLDDERVLEIESTPSEHGWSAEDRNVGREMFTWSQMLGVWQQGALETAWRLNDSHILWDTYTQLLLEELASTSLSKEAVTQAEHHVVNRLQIPHATWDQTRDIYSNFISRFRDGKNYEESMVAATRLGGDAKTKCLSREALEDNIIRASRMGDKEAELQAYSTYLDWEVSQSRRKNIYDFRLANGVYQRATLRFPAFTELWEGYVMFLIEEMAHNQLEKSVFSILDRATRHCPWSGTLWSQYLLAAETKKLSFTEVELLKHRATSSGLLDAGGMEEVLKVNTAWCGYLRRRAFDANSTDEDMDVAEVGIRSAIENMENLGVEKNGKKYQGDQEYRLQKIYIKYLSQGRNWESAREEFKKLIPRKGDSYEFWLRYYLWEMGTWSKLSYNEKVPNGQQPIKPKEATKVLARAIKRPKVDWPEKIIDTYQYHCEDNEDAEALQSSIAEVWKARRAVEKRRYEESLIEIDQQRQQAQLDVADTVDDSGAVGKRKREADEKPNTSKKIRPDIHEEVEPQMEEQHPSAPSLAKRDRENATVVVKNLPAAMTELKLRQLFRDCGTINSLKVYPEADGGSARASIEFDSKEDAHIAEIKDKKIVEEREIEVQVGTGSALYVCNFPPTADEVWVREQFSRYGEIVDIRFPSLKYNTHRRFCYVQFKTSRQAQEATQLDGKDLGSDLRLIAKISDPAHKQDRHGPIYEGRELFLANLDWQATKPDLRKAFSKYGNVEDVRIPTKINGQSKGIGFVVFSDKDEATAALEMNLTQLKTRILNVSIATNDKNKRQANRIITNVSQRSTVSPAPSVQQSHANGISPTPPPDATSKLLEIQSRTIALLNIPDTVNEARIRALAEPYGELVKVSLCLDHQGVILEYKDVASAGKASLGLEGQEIAPGRAIGVGSVYDMKQQKAEYRSDKIAVGAAKKEAARLQGPAPIRRPNQPNAKRGGRGGLGFKKASKEAAEPSANGNGEEALEQGKAKSNADFKAMFLKDG